MAILPEWCNFVAVSLEEDKEDEGFLFSMAPTN
jgi:hypothetical protein